MANWVNYRSKVRFSCFNSIIHYHRSKKEVQRTAESMSKASEDFSQHQGLKVSVVPSSLNPLSVKANYGDPSATSVEEDTSFTFDHCCKSEDSHSGSSPEANTEVHHKAQLKKSQSLGSALNRSGRVSSVIDSEDEIDQEFSCDHIDENNYAKLVDVLDHSGVGEPIGSKIPTSILLNQDVKAVVSESSQGNRMVCGESIFSIENTRQLEEGVGDTINHVPCRYLDDFGHRTPSTPPKIARSCSLPHIGVLSPTSKDGSQSQVYLGGRCKSSEDLNALCEKRKAFQNSVLGYHAVEEQDRDTGTLENSKSKYEIHPGDGYESYEHVHYEKDWRVPGMDEEGLIEKCEGESSVQNWNELPSKDFKTKRIAEWVNKIDLEESISLEDPNISPTSIDRVKRSYVSGSTSTAKLDSKITHGMEAAKNYVSSLPATSISAQLANLGLVVVPFLSAFVTLKTLNLSGNSIVRITSGALPRGLHVLNLAKNNISTVEGLRELTRLRVLDLSYNRLIRIGHGLASCSSLKELYLAGNKISEVEGLHRLLKLNIVDLRFNKISTAKCLGQLAANYSSLQAINLEGNPAQRNVGDEQLKKYLQSILPHLMYFNRQTIRASSSKEVTDRSARSAIASHQLDRGVRSENKLIRKGSHTPSTGKASSSSNHGSRVQAVFSSKQSKDRHGRLPPAETKGSHRHHYLDFGSKLFSLRPDLSMRRSQSEGHLGSS